MESLPGAVAEIRAFNRAYTRRFGLLDEQHLGSDLSLGEVRVLYELAHREGSTAAVLARTLELDPGHLSRMLGGLRRSGLVRRSRSPEAGRREFQRLDRKANSHVSGLLRDLSPRHRSELVRALSGVRRLLEPDAEGRAVVVRNHRVGDLGWILERHGAVYAEEWGWGAPFEAVVAQVVADFGKAHDPRREACWIAELGGERVGSVMLVAHPERPGVAKLRLLLVEPEARGLGVGKTLVDVCTRFARTAGYRKITLWTQSVLTAARSIYARAGYVKVSDGPNTGFGEGLVAETWELEL